jgi:hypothetical protein
VLARIARWKQPDLAERGHLVEDLDATVAEGDAMLALLLHALRRDNPNLGVAIDLRTRRADDFFRARDGEDCPFERKSGHAVESGEPLHEFRHLFVGQGPVMPFLALLRRQHQLQVPFPASWVLAVPPRRRFHLNQERCGMSALKDKVVIMIGGSCGSGRAASSESVSYRGGRASRQFRTSGGGRLTSIWRR